MSKFLAIIFTAFLTTPAVADWNVSGGSVGISVFGESGAFADGAQTYTGASGWGQAGLNYQTPVGSLTGSASFDYGAQNWANGPSQAVGGGFGTLTGSWFTSNSPCGANPCQGHGH